MILTGNERVYVVEYNYDMEYVNSWDVLHRINPPQRKVFHESGKCLVIATDKNEASKEAKKYLANKTNVKIISVEIQPWFCYDFYDGDEGGSGIVFDKKEIRGRHHIYGDVNGKNTLKTVVDDYANHYGHDEEAMSDVYDNLQQVVSYANEELEYGEDYDDEDYDDYDEDEYDKDYE